MDKRVSAKAQHAQLAQPSTTQMPQPDIAADTRLFCNPAGHRNPEHSAEMSQCHLRHLLNTAQGEQDCCTYAAQVHPVPSHALHLRWGQAANRLAHSTFQGISSCALLAHSLAVAIGSSGLPELSAPNTLKFCTSSSSWGVGHLLRLKIHSFDERSNAGMM